MLYDITHFTNSPETSVLNIQLWILCFDLQIVINDYLCGFKGDVYVSKKKKRRFLFESKSSIYYVNLLLEFTVHTGGSKLVLVTVSCNWLCWICSVVCMCFVYCWLWITIKLLDRKNCSIKQQAYKTKLRYSSFSGATEEWQNI